jgi:hypothetical protein
MSGLISNDVAVARARVGVPLVVLGDLQQVVSGCGVAGLASQLHRKRICAAECRPVVGPSAAWKSTADSRASSSGCFG